MAFSSLLDYFQSLFQTSGPCMPNGSELGTLVKLVAGSQTGISASLTGIANAVLLSATYNEVDVSVGSGAVMLPQALPGLTVYINNNTTNSIQVFGNNNNLANLQSNGNPGLDTIAPNSSVTQQPSATGVSQGANKVAQYICTTAGQWKQSLSA